MIAIRYGYLAVTSISSPSMVRTQQTHAQWEKLTKEKPRFKRQKKKSKKQKEKSKKQKEKSKKQKEKKTEKR